MIKNQLLVVLDYSASFQRKYVLIIADDFVISADSLLRNQTKPSSGLVVVSFSLAELLFSSRFSCQKTPQGLMLTSLLLTLLTSSSSSSSRTAETKTIKLHENKNVPIKTFFSILHHFGSIPKSRVRWLISCRLMSCHYDVMKVLQGRGD